MANSRELEFQYKSLRWIQVTGIIRAFFRTVMVLGVCAMVVFVARAFAGRVTLADIRVNMLAQMFGNRYAALTLLGMWGTGGTTWALFERDLRKRNIKRFSGEISEMQRLVDPKRRSSSLMSDGSTRPGDE